MSNVTPTIRVAVNALRETFRPRSTNPAFPRRIVSHISQQQQQQQFGSREFSNRGSNGRNYSSSATIQDQVEQEKDDVDFSEEPDIDEVPDPLEPEVVTAPVPSAPSAPRNQARRHKNDPPWLHQTPEERDKASIKQLYSILRELSERGYMKDAYALAKYLMTERKKRPQYKIYSALIASNVSTDGSVGRVLHLLGQLRARNIALDTGLCHGILKALAVHPDYVLRAEILQHMEGNWLGLTESGHHWVVAGLFREMQFERGLEALEQMRENGILVSSWLYELAAYTLIQIEEFEEALRVIQMRIADKGTERLTVLWSFLLDCAGEALHYDACAYVWKRCVESRYINPNSGACFNVLHAAARQGDVYLALDVLRVLRERNSPLDNEHYEMVIEAYVNSGNLGGALAVICEMTACGQVPDTYTTKPIYHYLSDQTDTAAAINEAIEELGKLKKAGVRVPPLALHVLLEVTGRARSIDLSLRIYNDFRTVCVDGPERATFSLLFAIARREHRHDLAKSFLADLDAMGFERDSGAYNSIILTSLYEGQVDEAMSYYQQMLDEGKKPFLRCTFHLARRLKTQKHARLDSVLDDLSRFGHRKAAKALAEESDEESLERDRRAIEVGAEGE